MYIPELYHEPQYHQVENDMRERVEKEIPVPELEPGYGVTYAACNEGYQAGFNDGYNTGFNDGREIGFDEGRHRGYPY